MKYINMEKIKNPLYSKLTTNLTLDAKKTVRVARKKTPMKNLRTESKENVNLF